MAKLTITLTAVDGSEKSADMYPDEAAGLTRLLMDLSSGRPDAPVCVTITRKDVIKKFRKLNEQEVTDD